MLFHMKTTLNISDVVMKRLKEEAAQSGKTMSELVELALRGLLEKKPREKDISPLPSFNGGRAYVNVANRDALYDVLDKS